MFGEFEDDAMESSDAKVDVVGEESLAIRIAGHVAQKTEVTVKSQQRGEPDLTVRERENILRELLGSNPSQFVYR